MKINDELAAKVESTNKQSMAKDELIRERDEKLEDMRTIVGRLTGTNNDMLAILSTKVRLEESFKTVETANMKLLQVRRKLLLQVFKPSKDMIHIIGNLQNQIIYW